MIRNSIKDYLVQIKEKQNDMLKGKLYDVNIRLYNNNKKYNKIIKSIINLMSQILYMDFIDYPTLKGISGANIGIPFNIIIIKIENSIKQMLNPIIIKRAGKSIKITSNCGSLLLSENITIPRSEIITVTYYDLNGNKKTEEFLGNNSGFTIQHEIEHNLGITLLTNKNNNP
ncbi:MAG: peptide deformylase [Patescibacteria group bacterium]|nr:peptide deformylase [Patescibacteria group bacterium]